jgi:valyl-tRNA synthetase
MPFITEEIWQQLPKPSGVPGSIMVTLFPMPDEKFIDEEAERQMALLMETVVAIRNVRADTEVPPSTILGAVVSAPAEKRAVLQENAALVERLARARLTFADARPKEKHAAHKVVSADVEVVVPLEGLIDFGAQRARLDRAIAKERKDVEFLEKKLDNQSFVERAPADVVEEHRARLVEAKERLTRLGDALKVITEP